MFKKRIRIEKFFTGKESEHDHSGAEYVFISKMTVVPKKEVLSNEQIKEKVKSLPTCPNKWLSDRLSSYQTQQLAVDVGGPIRMGSQLTGDSELPDCMCAYTLVFFSNYNNVKCQFGIRNVVDCLHWGALKQTIVMAITRREITPRFFLHF